MSTQSDGLVFAQDSLWSVGYGASLTAKTMRQRNEERRGNDELQS